MAGALDDDIFNVVPVVVFIIEPEYFVDNPSGFELATIQKPLFSIVQFKCELER